MTLGYQADWRRPTMQDSKSTRWRPEIFARKWQALAERRRAHLAELYANGHWKRYFSEEAFRAQMRDAVREVERWSVIADPDAAKSPPAGSKAPRPPRAA
jgi:uncharacterized repeat protein (TIGR03809 family)